MRLGHLFSVAFVATACTSGEITPTTGDGAADDAAADTSIGDANGDAPLTRDGAADVQVSRDGMVEPDSGVSDINPLDGIGEVTLVDDGFSFTEGPVWDNATGTLLFSDMVFGDPSQGRTLRFTPPSSFELFRQNTQNGNGMAFLSNGSLLICEQNGRKVTQRTPGGDESTFTDAWADNALNSPNDIVATSAGDVYFTDPPYGLPNDGAREIAFNGVFYKAGGSATIDAVWEGDADTEYPNGIALSPHEMLLYVADNRADVVRKHSIEPDGGLEAPTKFADVDSPDGMTVDGRGNLYITTNGGIDVFAADGSSWGKINVPKRPSNCAFGGTNGRTLYITARDSLYSVELAAQ